MWISPDNEKIFYNGRIDWSERKEPTFVFPATYALMRFTGKKIKIHVRNKNAYWENYLGYILDGVQGKAMLNKDGETVIELNVVTKTGEEIEIEKSAVKTADLQEDVSGKDLKDSHEITLFKRQDACHEMTFLGVELEADGELLELPETVRPSARKIEVYGDSVSAGEVSEAVDFVGKPDPEHNGEFSNSWYSYAWMTARKLNAQIHDIAQGGIALLDHTGWFYEPEAVGMESAWDKVHYNPQFNCVTKWDFTRYTPQVVIVAIGQNDNHPVDYMKEDYDSEQSVNWRSHYKKFIQTLRNQYPDAHIVCITTLLEHDPSWDKAIGQVVQELEDEKVTQCLFKRNGKGTPGHLRIPEAEEMSDELAEYINGLDITEWK